MAGARGTGARFDGCHATAPNTEASRMTENRGRNPAGGTPGEPGKPEAQDKAEARRQVDASTPKANTPEAGTPEASKPEASKPEASKPEASKPNDDAPAGEEMTGEGSPGLTIMGGGGHA
jgi:hypothetical protein